MQATQTHTLTPCGDFPGLFLQEDSRWPGCFNKHFLNGKPAYRIHIVGRLALPEGDSVLYEDLPIIEQAGGNNDCRKAVLPKGAQVAYYRTGGQYANILFADVMP